MATWRDGPEYAPVERPDAYLTSVAPLEQPTGPPPVFEPPAGRPIDFGEPDAAVPLAELAAPPVATRDPREEFDVVSTPLTTLAPTALPAEPPSTPTPPPTAWPAPAAPPPTPAPSAWGSIHARPSPRPSQPWVPAQPISLPEPPLATPPSPTPSFPPPTLNQPPFPTTGQWYPPPAPNGRRPNPSLGDIVRAVTPGVLISLAVGVLVSALAIPLLIVAHALSSRVWYRRARVHRAFVVVESAIAFLGGVTMYATYGYADALLWWQSASTWTQLGNFLLIILVMLVVGQGALHGDQRESR